MTAAARQPTSELLCAAARAGLACALACGSASVQAQAAANAPLALEELSLEELANVPVTSVTGRPQSVQRAAASIYVISGDDIRRSAATNLPEALRLAPNLQVARLNAGQWAISARGFNNTIGNKLLVLVDGRTIYSPLFSGVFWDAQDVMLEDVDRIEVISGPGATLWGANAVNGVINVITRSALETQGTLAVAQGGGAGWQARARHGLRFGDGGALRFYAARVDRDNTLAADGSARADANQTTQAGFRADWEGEADQGTLQGDVYDGGGPGTSNLAARLSGGNVLARWAHRNADGSNWRLQATLDHARRQDDVIFRDRTDTADITFDHAPVLGPGHKLLWGAGHREARSTADATALVLFDPRVQRLRWTHVFVQDEMQVAQALQVTAGVKVETNVYTGAEVLPTLRASLDVGPAQTLWASASRAVRAPARLDRDFYFPATAPFVIAGGPNFRSEVAKVVELGYRAQVRAGVNLSATAFHHDYDRLRAGRPTPPTRIENLAGGRVWGVESWGHVDVVRGWRVSAGLVELRKSLRQDAAAAPGSIANLGNDPRHQWLLRSSADLGGRVQFDAALRHVGALPDPAVPAYTVADLKLAWSPWPLFKASVSVQNLGGSGHIEFNPADASRLERAALLTVEVRLP